MFIAVDGIDGSGKTTLVKQLAELFADWSPLTTKEPTNTSEWGRALRDAATKRRLSRKLELKYFHADRLHHISNEIIPALEKGRVVITDRYVDSTLAFQAKDPSSAEELYAKLKKDILVPDITFILDCPVEIGLRRVADRDGGSTSAFETHESLTTARLIYKTRKNRHYALIDASGSVGCTLKQALEILRDRFGNWHEGFAQHIDRFTVTFVEPDSCLVSPVRASSLADCG